jgi:peptidoglycan/LPS O-acetylase OafA/YrhL
LAEQGSVALGVDANIAVAVFFIISGLVLTRGWDGNYPLFLARRFVRLWPVFAICLAASSVLAWRRPAALEFIWLPLPHYDVNKLCPPMWSLFIEAWTAVVMPAIVWSARGGLLRTLASMGLCVGVAVSWWPESLELRAFVCYIVCFVAGAGLSRVSLRSGLLERPELQWLGRISYSLYLTHWLVLRAATEAFGLTGTLLGLPACFLVAQVMWRYVEYPSVRMSRRLSRIQCVR